MDSKLCFWTAKHNISRVEHRKEWFIGLVLAVLLAISGVESNPGPNIHKKLCRRSRTRSLTDAVVNMREEMREFYFKFDTMADDIDYMKNSFFYMEEKITTQDHLNQILDVQSRRNNLVFHGIPEAEKETEEDIERLVYNVIVEEIGVSLEAWSIGKAYRVGRHQECRPIIVQFLRNSKKMEVLKKGRKLANAKIRVREDLPLHVRQVRGKLRYHLQMAKKQGQDSAIRGQKLVVDGEEYELNELERRREVCGASADNSQLTSVAGSSRTSSILSDTGRVEAPENDVKDIACPVRIIVHSAKETEQELLEEYDSAELLSVLPSAETTATQVLAKSVLQFSSISVPAVVAATPPVPPPAPAPIFVEAPPSSDDNEDDPGLRVADSRFLNGSSSNLLAKSAPSTPQGERLQAGTAFPATTQTAATAVGPVPRSPSHVFSRHDKQALKQLSVSAPVMTQAQAAARPQPASDPAVTPAEQHPGSSKSRQKKFHRHFKQVADEERVLNYYSCALVGDILLQGHLYITKNYFAFYSNVFGYVTKLLIPTVSVLKISKEKTARIIPNAVGVATEDDKHVFCSLLSRDSTYRLMVQVWKTAMSPGPQNTLPITQEMKDEVDSASGDIHPNEEDDDSSSVSGSERSCPPTPIDSHTDVSHSEGYPSKLPNGNVGTADKPARLATSSSLLPRPTLILIVSTGLLVLLFLSAAFLLYRIGRIHTQFAENPLLTGSDEVYQEILKWQTQLHSKSANEVQEFLNANLDQLAKVRQSLEALSLLIVSDDSNKNRSPVTPEHHQQAAAPLPREKHS
ncbi:uncharacterized protein [Periplaneta americana]|uniref:uncharacterized protein isoform X2 n=1 Tax=Periplaneta americana TaxID=6978 RepID=UPI0037E926DE